MLFTLMCDDNEIGYLQEIDGKKYIVLVEGVPLKHTPVGLFKGKDKVSLYDFMKWLEDRVFPEERVDCQDLLFGLGLDRYDPWAIVKDTRGTMMTDEFWFKVKPEDTYETCSIRGLMGIKSVRW